MLVAMALTGALAIEGGPESGDVFATAWAAGVPRASRAAGVDARRERALGASVMDAREIIEEVLVEEEGETAERGAVILGVQRHGPAARAGLEPADAIVELGGERVSATVDLWRILGSRELGTLLPVTFVRDGELRSSVLEVPAGPGVGAWQRARARGRLHSSAASARPAWPQPW